MHRRTYLATGAAAAAGLAGCSGQGDDDREQGDTGGDDPTETDSGGSSTATATVEPTATESDQDVDLLNHEWYLNEEEFVTEAGVRGTAKNVSGEELSYVAVNVYFLDSEGTQIGDSLDNTSGLAADREWAFDAAFFDENPEDVAEYEIEVETSGF